MNDQLDRAVLAGGCFWGMQDLIRKLPGVEKTRVGYTGGDVKNATYRNHGTHAEGIEIYFDPSVISFEDILACFFQIHDPTTLNRQGNDMGPSYRSEIYYVNEAQRETAEDVLQRVNASGLWPGPVVTKVSPSAISGKRSPSTKTTCNATPRATPATIPARTGSCRNPKCVILSACQAAYFVVAVNTPSQPSPGGLASPASMRSS